MSKMERPSNQIAISSKKEKRLEAKKRKLEAFLKLYSSNVDNNPKKNKSESQNINCNKDKINHCSSNKDDCNKKKPASKSINSTKYEINHHFPKTDDQPKGKSESKSINSTKNEINYCFPKIDQPKNNKSESKNMNSTKDDISYLTKQLIKYRTKILEPTFYLVDKGLKAQVKFHYYNKDNQPGKITCPLFVQDIHDLLMKALLGNISPYPLKWAKLLDCQRIKVVLIVIEGLSKNLIVQNVMKLENTVKTFPYMLDIISSNVPFATELCTMHLLSGFKNNMNVPKNQLFSSIFPIESGEYSENKIKFSKLHLLLSPIQLLIEKYPLPKALFKDSQSEGYIFTKNAYKQVTENSPMFALDCEMCQTTESQSELIKIAIIDENYETIYTTLVKPKTKIVDYMTKFSGVTEQMLENVETTLEDVQKQIQMLLPSDAILCGQSLNCDLHALKMIHPYVIDTSVIYNTSGIRWKKTSLKQLAATYLNESIQDNKEGHSPVEDAIAAMKLVQLKLKESYIFGDAVLGYKNTFHSNTKLSGSNDEIIKGTNDISNKPSNNNQTSDLSPKLTNAKTNNESRHNQGFFSKLNKHSKRVCIVGTQDSLNSYCPETLKNKVTKIFKTRTKKIAKTTSRNIVHYDLMISHLSFDADEIPHVISTLDSNINQIYEACQNNSLFVVYASGVDSTDSQEFKNGLCMISLKVIN